MKYRHIILVLAVIVASCGTNPAVTGLVGLDAALDGAVTDIESKLPNGTPIVVTVINAPHNETREFLGEELSSRFKNLKTLARESALNEVMKEQDFQMSGMVSDESAVGIGHFTGAQAVITGDIRSYADFTQLRLRIVNVRTSEAFIYSARINNNDRLLANIQPSAASSGDRPARVSTRAIDYLNRGNDFLVEGRPNEALNEFDQAITINSRFAEAFRGRGIAYFNKGDYERAIEEFNQAIRLKPRYAEAYNSRGIAYSTLGIRKNTDSEHFDVSLIAEFNLAVEDFASAIRLNPNYAEAYVERGQLTIFLYESIHQTFDYSDEVRRGIADYSSAIRINPNLSYAYLLRSSEYFKRGEFDLGMADLNKAIQIEPNVGGYYVSRGNIYMSRGDGARAIADYNQAIRIFTNNIQTAHTDLGVSLVYSDRGEVYEKIGDLDRAIADYTSGIQVYPNSAINYSKRASVYEKKGDLNRAIADYEAAMRLGFFWYQSTIDRLRQQQSR